MILWAKATKSNLLTVRVGLCQGCPLSLILFVIFTDMISKRSRGEEDVWLGNLQVPSLLFADYVVLLASSSFSAHWSGSRPWFSTGKKGECSLLVGDESLPKVEEFKYLGILFTSDGRL